MSNRTMVGDGGVEVESVGQLARPLIAQTRRREDEDSLDGTSRQKLRHDQACLNRLP